MNDRRVPNSGSRSVTATSATSPQCLLLINLVWFINFKHRTARRGSDGRRLRGISQRPINPVNHTKRAPPPVHEPTL